VQIIREGGILRNFPNRTETDLYLWISEQRALLEIELGWRVPPEAALRSLVDEEANLVHRVGGKLLSVLPFEKFEAGPPAGQWREETLSTHRDDRLFTDLLVPVNGRPDGWFALEQAILIARREGAQLHGLHVVQKEAQREGKAALAIQEQFNRRCSEEGVAGGLVIGMGEISSTICAHARWVDLIVANLAYPPPPQPLARLDSGFRDLIQRCPRPILAVPQTVAPLERALLAYDGSAKAEEALFVATYLAGRWQIPLVVLTVVDSSRAGTKNLDRARGYLETHGVRADYITRTGEVGGQVGAAVIDVGEEHQCELLLMGGYGYNPVLEVVLGSAVDQVLRESRKPVLICR
jgi:nucleotide-binding universal stress UspA family protein